MTMKVYRRNVALGAYSLLNIISTSRQCKENSQSPSHLSTANNALHRASRTCHLFQSCGRLLLFRTITCPALQWLQAPKQHI